MACPAWISVTGAWLAFISSLLLAYPGWRVSVLLRETYRLLQTNENINATSGETDYAVQALAESFKKDAEKWLPNLHWLLLIGLLFMVISGFLGILGAYCA